ncbi:MAG: hypothetical protein JJ971_14820 [Balneolaceae bacterium]|nr:hypothetical protein [Balneolaceae bacterium]MBO6547671.1 hypothetical protein [Balneolaceae bacterium]MBO6648182.1 hypothetical protein [Balneolaceae bacterium]
MKKEEIDQLIEESLSKEDAQFYHDLDQQGMFKQWGGLYSGKLGKWAIVVTTFQIIITLLAFWLGYKFFTVEDSILMAKYGVGLLIGVIMNGLLKQWHWMQMDKNSILLEMKRLEFQVAILTEKLSGK